MSKCEVETPYLAGLFDSKGTIIFDEPDKNSDLSNVPWALFNK